LNDTSSGNITCTITKKVLFGMFHSAICLMLVFIIHLVVSFSILACKTTQI